MLSRPWMWCAAVSAALWGVVPAPAHACGGLFCDNGPQPMPVDQTGENILFVLNGTQVEAHIQIQYTGDAPRFSWVIPVTTVPTFGVGSQLLFNELLRFSVPRYMLVQQVDQCGVDQSPFPPYPGSYGSEDLSSVDPTRGETGGPTVLEKRQVGAFDITVLSTGSAAELMTWLSDNNYVQLPGTQALVEQYVAENHLFAAIKLVNGAGVRDIHPLVMRYQGVPCVPLRLTAVAAQADMGVRTFFLGNGRVVPRHYKHLEVNPARIDWVNNAQNYMTVLSNAANDPVAGGQAFVTEYAGSTISNAITGLNESAFYSPAWNANVFTSMPPELVVTTLEGQGLVDCFNAAGPDCSYFHPLVQGLLRQYVPLPAGTSELEFYGDLQRNAARIDRTAWDGAAFTAAMQQRVVDPAAHAVDLVRRSPYLTRLFTVISPDEMTVDPEFHERADLPDVDVLRTATQTRHCNGEGEVTVAQDMTVYLRDASTWPTLPDSVPWAWRIQDIPPGGEVVTLVDNTQVILGQLDRFNDSQRGSRLCACAAPGQGWAFGAWLLAGVGLWRARRRT